MGPELLGSIITAGAGLGSSVASGIASGKMNRRAVKYNKWALQEQQNFQSNHAQLGRDWSEEMMSKANQWNLDQWNRENEYNLPENQKARLLAAGINPALAMQGASGVGQAASSPSSASAPSPVSPSGAYVPSLNLQRPDYGSGFAQLSSAVNSYFENKQKSTVTEGYGLDNVLKARYGDRSAQLSLGKTESEIDSIRASTAKAYADSALINLNAKEKQILNKYLDAGQQLSLFLKIGELASMKSQRELMSAQTRKAIADEIEVSARARGQKISNRVAAEVADRLIVATNEENRYRGIHARSAAYWAPQQEYYKNKQMSVDLGSSEVAKAMAEFERYTKDTPGNRWIQKNIVPVSSAISPLLDAAAMFTVAGGIGKAAKVFKPKYGKMKKYSFE
jgi:F0F1-type ATP synthase membrane subunit c/vacuolar-type H+-ATPase subunit K